MNRRQLLQSSFAIPLTPALAISPEAARVTIREVEVFRLKVNRRGDWLIVRTRTNQGLTGLGDASHSGNDDEARRLLKQYAEQLRGRGIFDAEALRQWGREQIGQGGQVAAVAFSAIEQSLWDVRGQALGVPAHQSFG